MSPEEWRVRIEDILDAIGRIQHYTADLEREDFYAEQMVQDAVIRNFTVTGEDVPYETRSRYPNIPWNRMRGMRNFVVHGYSDVDPRIVWDTIQDDLPSLKPKLEEILERER